MKINLKIKSFLKVASWGVVATTTIGVAGIGFGPFSKLEPKTFFPQNQIAKKTTDEQIIYIPGIGPNLKKQEQEAQLLANSTQIPVITTYRNNYQNKDLEGI